MIDEIPELPKGALRFVAIRSFLKEMTISLGRKSDEREVGLLIYLML
jgi:hypothetical protein